MVLFINACVRKDSRTLRLANAYLKTRENAEIRQIDLSHAGLSPLTEKSLAWRTERVAAGDFSDAYFDTAKTFAAAEEIVIAAPFWDGSFPSALKTYIENVYVQGIVTKFSPKGEPVGLCRAKELVYVTTAGGPYDGRFSFDYFDALAKNCFGIAKTRLIFAENLDLYGNDAETIMECKINEIQEK